MDRVRQVVICGQSIFMLAIEAGLAALPEVEVIRFDSRLPAVADGIVAREPDVVVVERNSGIADLTLALLARDIVLVELDAAEGTVTVLTARQVPITQVRELAQVMQRIAAARS